MRLERSLNFSILLFFLVNFFPLNTYAEAVNERTTSLGNITEAVNEETSSQETKADAEVTEVQNSGLKTAVAESVTVKHERMLDGVIEAVKRATLTAQTSGRVIRINYDVDDYVKKGAELLRFRDKDQRARYDGALANAVQAESEYARTKDLYKKKLVSKSTMDKAEARLIATRAARDQAKESLEHTRVRAPYSGIVVQRHIEVGETATVGRKLFTGLSLEQLRATVNVPEDLINRIRQNKQARIVVERAGGLNIEAKSLTISPYADPASHTFVVRVNLPEGDYHIYPGMFAKVGFVLDEEIQLAVPKSAVVYRSEIRAIYVLDENNKLHFRHIRLGKPLDSERVAILAGLTEGERVALNPIQAVIELKEQQGGE